MRILAIDPGRRKCGFAVVEEEGVVDKGICETSNLKSFVKELIKNFNPEKIIIGNKTYSIDIKEILEKEGFGLNIELIDEHLSSEAARRLYFKENPPKGFKKFIPISLQTPPVLYDDYQAIVLALKYLKKLDI